MKEKIVLTAALPYANGKIHVGHLLEYIQVDIFSRFLKLQGQDALYICASDMHGTPIEINAKKADIKPEKFVEKYWKEHQEDFAKYFIKFDNYYKTHSKENKELSECFFNTLKKKGYIYRKRIKIIYCEHCRRFLPDRFVKGTCPHCREKEQYGDVCEKCGQILKGIDLIDPYCVICKNRPVKKESEHYFFKLSEFAGRLKTLIDSKKAEIQPEMKNWLKGWLKKGLEDWCISRDAPYFGFEIPNSKKEMGEIKYFYVWLDAPIGYISSTKNYCDKKGLNWKDYWQKGKVYQFIGKDIAYFHYLFWTAMLMGAGVPVPKINTHGWITVNGQKMSKSRGTFFTAKDFLRLYPAEALRFYYANHLNKKVVDVDLNLDNFKAVNNNVFVGNLGNFCYRVLTFAEKNYGKIKEIKTETALIKRIDILTKKIEKNYLGLDFKSAVRNILQIADLGNAYFQKKEPWKEKEKKQKEVAFCLQIARNLAILVSPILPEFSRKIQVALGEKDWSWDNLSFNWQGKLKKVEKLVEKIDLKQGENKQGQDKDKSREDKKKFPLQLKVGKIMEVKDHPHAETLYLLKVDFGTEKKQVVAGLKKYFSVQELLNAKTVFCTNLKTATIRGEESEAMILVADDKKNLALLEAELSPVGEEVHFDGLKWSGKEIVFNEFLKITMTTKKGKVMFGDRILTGVTVKNVKDGAKIS